MAQIAASFTNDQARYDEITFQRGKVVIDGELNDGQRIQRIATKRLKIIDRLQSNLQEDSNMLDAPMFSSGMRIITAEEDGTVGSDEVKIEGNPDPGKHKVTLVEFRGYTFEMAEIQTFAVAAAGGAIQTQQLYMTLREVENGPAQDPSIQVNALGETSVRVFIEVVFKIGAVDTLSAEADNTVAEPWEAGGVAAGVIAEIVRDPGNVSLTRSNVRYRYRMVPEMLRRNLQFMHNGKVSLRQSIHARESAEAYVEKDLDLNKTFNISRLAVLVGAHSQRDSRESMSIRVDVSIDFIDFTFGDCLVIQIPNNPSGHAVKAGIVSLDEYEAVYNAVPGEGQVLLRVERFADWGENQSTRNDYRNLDDRFVLCANLTNPSSSIDNELTMDIIFCDGQRITEFRDLSKVKPALHEQHGISWDTGEAVLTAPGQGNPNSLNTTVQNNLDETPYRVGQVPPLSSEFKALFSQKLENISGIDVFLRFYAFDDLALGGVPGPNGDPQSGFCMTVNAAWQANTSQWERDIDNHHSAIFYFGGVLSTTSSPADDEPGTFIGQAMHSSAAPDFWPADEWVSPTGSVTTKAVQSLLSYKGFLTTSAGNNAEIETYKSMGYSGNETLPADTRPNRLFARNINKAYGTLRKSGAVVSVDADHSFNVASVAVVNVDPSPSYIEVTLTKAMAGSKYSATANLQTWSGDETDPANMLVIYRVLAFSSTKIRIFAYDHAQSSWILGILNEEWEISFIAHGKQN